MKIRMVTTMAGPEGVRQAGQVYDIKPAVAKKLIQGSYAKEVKEAKKQATKQATKQEEENSEDDESE